MDRVVGRPCCLFGIGRLDSFGQPSLSNALELMQGECVGHLTSSPIS